LRQYKYNVRYMVYVIQQAHGQCCRQIAGTVGLWVTDFPRFREEVDMLPTNMYQQTEYEVYLGLDIYITSLILYV
jgi:hypothetical protein